MSDDSMSLDHTLSGGGRGDDLNITLTIELDGEVKRLIQRIARQFEE